MTRKSITMNRWILLVLIPIVFLGFLGNSKIGLALPNSANVSLSPESSRAIIFKDIFVDVVISDVANLRGWGFQLFYETNCLDAIDVTEGPFLKSFTDDDGTNFVVNEINDNYNGTHGLIWAYCFMRGMPSQPAAGNGVLATIEFRSSDIGTSHMAFYYPGIAYPVKLNDMGWKIMPCTASGADVTIYETTPLDINIDVGELHFPGEQVECYVMTTFLGISITPNNINAILYDPTGELMQLSLQSISTGLYKTTYTLPSDASSGTWAIVVEATYSPNVQAPHFGRSFKTFLLSSTLNSKLVHIDNTVAWIQTNVGLLQTDVDNLQMHVTAIEGSTATIRSTLGTMQGTITSINNNIATIQTDIGTVKLDISTVEANTTPKTVDWTTIGLYVSLALLVSIVVVLVVLYLYLRARFRLETSPS